MRKRRWIILVAAVFFGCQKGEVLPVVQNINRLEAIIEDMAQCGEALPADVPASINWRACPRLGYGIDPQHMTAAIPWGQLYETAQGNTAGNTRVQIRNIYLYYLSKREKVWKKWTDSYSVEGSWFVADFADNQNKPAAVRPEPDGGGISVQAGNGYNFHFWPTTGRVLIDTSDIAGVWSYCEARLILDDPAGPDDREQAEYILSMGADYWLDLTAQWDPSWYNNGDIAIGRFKYVRPEWRAFNMHTLSEQQLRVNPPPFR